MAVPETSEEGSIADTVELSSTDGEEEVRLNDNVPDVQTSEDDLEQRKQELEKICTVLEINYKMKLTEFGSKIDKERVDAALTFLRVTRDNFSKLKTISDEIIKEWKASDTPLKRMYKLSWIMYIHDSATANELRGQNFLSLAFVNKATKELDALQKERCNKYKKKYSAQKEKLTRILSAVHLTRDHVQFEEHKPGNADEYRFEKRRLKRLIKEVKSYAADRKEFVLRIEMIRQAIYSEWNLEDIDDLIESAKNVAADMNGDPELVPYDGQNVADILSKLRGEAMTSATTREDKAKMTDGLRSGNIYKK